MNEKLKTEMLKLEKMTRLRFGAESTWRKCECANQTTYENKDDDEDEGQKSRMRAKFLISR